MGLPIHKKRKMTSESALGYFSDLFAALTFVFLFLYIISSLQNNILGVAERFNAQELEKKYQDQLQSVVERYEATIKAYQGEVGQGDLYDNLLAKISTIEQKSSDEIREREEKIKVEEDFISESKNKVEEIDSLRNMVRNLLKANELSTQKVKKELEQQFKREGSRLEKEYLAKVKQQTDASKKYKDELERQHKLKSKTLQEEYDSKIAAETKELRKLQREMKKEQARENQRLKNELGKAEAEAKKLEYARKQMAIRHKNDEKRLKFELAKLDRTAKTLAAHKRKIADERQNLESVYETKIQEKTKALDNYKKELEKQHVQTAQNLQKEYEEKINREKLELEAYKQSLAKKTEMEQQSIQDKYNEKITKEKKAIETYKDRMKEQQTAMTSRMKSDYLAKIKQAEKDMEEYREKLASETSSLKKKQEDAYREKIKKQQEAMKAYKTQMEKTAEQIKKEYELKAKKDREFMKQFKEKLAKQSEDDRAEIEKERAKLQQERKNTIKAKQEAIEDLNKKMATANKKLKKEYQEKIKHEQANLNYYKKQVQERTKLLKDKIDELNKKASVRKNIVANLQKTFKKNNIDAEINPQTGEVVIPFHETYFDFGKHELKPQMKKAIDQVIPAFAEALFGDSNLAKNISSLEIVGWASPVYKGNIITGVNTPLEKEALSFNMNLSYLRAKAIFDYVFSASGRHFRYKKKMLHSSKVASLSHIVSKLRKRKGMERVPANTSSICKIYNCKEWQKVAIKINLID